MRIGLVAPPWLPVPPPSYGGTEQVVDLLARGLQAAGHEVLLAAASDSTCPVPRVPGMGLSDPAAMGTAMVEAAHIVRAYHALGGVDVIHDHSTIGPIYGHRPAGVPVVCTNHGPYTADSSVVYRQAASAGVHVVAISARQAELARDIPISATIHHGLETAAIAVGDGAGGYAAFLGRMSPDKGVREAIAVARAAGVPLRIAAKMRESAEKSYFKRVIAPLLGGGVEYVGELDRAQKYAFLGGAFALLNPLQWEEPFGLVMAEALAAGTPVVAIPRGSAPEIVRHGVNGFLAPLQELAGWLPRARELDRRACREDAVARFDVVRMVSDHVRLYERLGG